MTIPAFTTNDRRPPATSNVIDCSFTRTGSGLVADEAQQVGNTGSGMTVAQSGGNLLIDTGTTANAEFIWRSRDFVTGAHMARIKMAMSQRIAQQNVVIALADLIGENLACTTASDGLSMTVTLPVDHGFTSLNVGQAIHVGGAIGFTSATPGRYIISAVSGNLMTLTLTYACTWTRSTTTATVTFVGGNPYFAINEGATVSGSSDVAAIVNGAVTLLTQTSGGVTTFTCLNAGATSGTLNLTMSAKAWTGSQTGTVTLYGWNCITAVKNGTSATAIWIDSQRKGWASGQSTVTAASDVAPGAVFQFYGDGQTETYSDGLPATVASTSIFSGRATRIESLPSVNDELFLFVSVFNGVSAPASTTRVTIGHFRMVDIGIQKVQVSAFEQTGSITNLGTITVTQGTGSSLNAQVTGAAAQGATATGNPVLTGGVAKTAQPTARTDGQVVAPLYSKVGHTIGRLGQVRDLSSEPAMVTITNTTETTLAAAVASTFNDLAGLIISSTAVFTGTPTGVRLDFRDTTGGTVRFSISLSPTAASGQSFTPSWIGQEIKQATVNTNWTVQLAFVGGTAPAVGSGDIRIMPKIVANI